MNIFVDDINIFTVTDHHKKVLKNNISKNKLDDFVKASLFSIINSKYEACFKRLKAEWEPKLLARGITSIPTNKDAFAELVFSQLDYKDRSARETESVL